MPFPRSLESYKGDFDLEFSRTADDWWTDLWGFYAEAWTVLLLLVGIAIAYDTFFADHTVKEISKININDLNINIFNFLFICIFTYKYSISNL
jgi:hypothetical protein